MTLVGAQLLQLRELTRKLVAAAQRTQRSSERAPAGEEFSNVFGIIGPRGAGKSTLLSSLAARRKELQEEIPDLAHLFIAKPLDCSTVLEGVEPGAALLLHLEDQDLRLDTKLKGELGEVVARYMRMSREHRELRLDLANTPESFSSSMVADLRERLGLAATLERWLAAVCRAKDIWSIVLLLDDFDLVAAPTVRLWFRALLDELHQTGLLLVLTGDYNRLEHLIFDTQAEIDDKTGRAQLDKLLPWQHRVLLDRWPANDRRAFRGRYADPAVDPLEKTLGRNAPGELESMRQCLIELLPLWPRGLANLYDSLAAATFPPGPAAVRDLLALLATCRGEPLWARRLQGADLDDWESFFLFEPEDLSFEDWAATTEAARDPVRDVGQAAPSAAAEGGAPRRESGFQPIRGLIPAVPGGREDRAYGAFPPTAPYSAHRRLVPVRTTRVRIETADASSGPDPLRHEELWRAPLRDVAAGAEPVWIELLLDLSFSLLWRPDPGWPVRNRLRFLDAWAPAQHRLGRAEIVVSLPRRQWEAFFDDYRDLDLQALLSWLDLALETDRSQVRSRIGWPVLVEALRRGQSTALPLELAQLGLVGHRAWRHKRAGQATRLDLIPAQLRALILLVDGLDRGGWSWFTADLGWHPPTYFALAGALAQAAYLHALVRAGDIDPARVEKPQTSLIEALDNRDPGFILGRDDKEALEELVFERLAAVLRCGLPTGRESSLREAADHFMQSPPYRALVDLVDRELLT